MTTDGWRTIIINKHASLSYSENNLVVKTDSVKNSIPISQIKTVLINTGEVSLTARLVCELNACNVKVIFCDSKHLPCCETVGYHNCGSAPGKIRTQLVWSEDSKDRAWTKIVRQKIMSQYSVLKRNDIENAEMLKEYADHIDPEDPITAEAHAARVYFSALFGNDFNRRTDCIINSALNYGYAVLLSDVSRCISAHGYLTEIGLHHSCYNNPFNLSCDLMEPFRAYVDDFVYNNSPEEFNADYRKKLVEISIGQVLYNRRRMDMQTAIDMYVNDVLNELSDGSEHIKELSFVEQV